MPTYIYRCNNCEYQFEEKQRFADAPLTDCPDCREEQSLRKVVNSVGVVFKGNGFYITDNRGKVTNASSPNGNGSNGSSANGASANGTNGSSAESAGDNTAKKGTDSTAKKSEKSEKSTTGAS